MKIEDQDDFSYETGKVVIQVEWFHDSDLKRAIAVLDNLTDRMIGKLDALERDYSTGESGKAATGSTGGNTNGTKP